MPGAASGRLTTLVEPRCLTPRPGTDVACVVTGPVVASTEVVGLGAGALAGVALGLAVAAGPATEGLTEAAGVVATGLPGAAVVPDVGVTPGPAVAEGFGVAPGLGVLDEAVTAG